MRSALKRAPGPHGGGWRLGVEPAYTSCEPLGAAGLLSIVKGWVRSEEPLGWNRDRKAPRAPMG